MSHLYLGHTVKELKRQLRLRFPTGSFSGMKRAQLLAIFIKTAPK